MTQEDEQIINDQFGNTGIVLSATRGPQGWSFTVKAANAEIYAEGLKIIELEYNKHVDPDKLIDKGYNVSEKHCQFKNADGTVCGELAVYKTGVSKAGKPYHGLFCSKFKEHVDWSYKE